MSGVCFSYSVAENLVRERPSTQNGSSSTLRQSQGLGTGKKMLLSLENYM